MYEQIICIYRLRKLCTLFYCEVLWPFCMLSMDLQSRPKTNLKAGRWLNELTWHASEPPRTSSVIFSRDSPTKAFFLLSYSMFTILSFQEPKIGQRIFFDVLTDIHFCSVFLRTNPYCSGSWGLYSPEVPRKIVEALFWSWTPLVCSHKYFCSYSNDNCSTPMIILDPS